MKKIAIIDDDKIVCAIYRARFESDGFEVATAADGEAGLALVSSFRPDVVLLDLGLPVIDGVEVVRRLRASAATAALPILVFTNSYQPAVLEHALQVGANRCLRKMDSTPQAVSDTVRELLPAPAAPAAVASAAPDQSRYLTEFAKTSIADLRATLKALYESPSPTRCPAELEHLHRSASNLTACTALNGLRPAAQLANILEVLLEELLANPSDVTLSTLRTMSQVVDVLADVHHIKANPISDLTAIPPKILVVDDDAMLRQLITFALEKAGLNSLSLGSATTALEVLDQNRFDLIFLDIVMPEHNGYEICERIRLTPEHAETPVIFITGQCDFQNFTHASLSGGTDLIAKPFLPVELAAKALVHLFSHRCENVQAPNIANAA